MQKSEATMKASQVHARNTMLELAEALEKAGYGCRAKGEMNINEPLVRVPLDVVFLNSET